MIESTGGTRTHGDARVPDFTIRQIDHGLAERIQALARVRQWTVNDVLLHALRRGLGYTESGARSEALVDVNEPGPDSGSWNATEQAVFSETVRALSLARGDAMTAIVRGEG